MSGNARTLVIKFKFLPHDFDGIAALKKHIGKVINPCVCIFPAGGWKISSTSDNSRLSKVYLCQFVAEKILGFAPPMPPKRPMPYGCLMRETATGLGATRWSVASQGQQILSSRRNIHPVA